uniref:Uncharacterized protein n=1 Tax=Oryza meridionalis TaxID=40149 RepID=A0A0E0E195_9ORYZ
MRGFGCRCPWRPRYTAPFWISADDLFGYQLIVKCTVHGYLF